MNKFANLPPERTTAYICLKTSIYIEISKVISMGGKQLHFKITMTLRWGGGGVLQICGLFFSSLSTAKKHLKEITFSVC